MKCETSFPDDPYNRLWQPFMDDNPVVESHANITPSDFWNKPPEKVFHKGITTSRGKTLRLLWPAASLPSSNYYIALYFQDNRSPSPYSWRAFNVSINGMNFFTNLNVTTDGLMVYGTEWPLSGQTEIVMTPGTNVPVGPVINAGEIFQMLPKGGRTLVRDGIHSLSFLLLVYMHYFIIHNSCIFSSLYAFGLQPLQWRI